MRTYFAALLGAVALLAPYASAQTNPLTFKPVAADYSRALDKMILVSASPNQLHIYTAAGAGDTTVSLSKAPTSVSVSPDGLFAAVGHDQLITYVDLTGATVVKTLTVSVNVPELQLGATFVYVVPNLSVEIATGIVTTRADAVPATGGRLMAASNSIFSTRTGATPNDIDRFDVSTGPISGRTDSPYSGQFDICGKIWFSLDNSRIYNSCATVFRSDNLQYQRSFPTVSRIVGLAESVSLAYVATVPDPTVSGQNDREIRLFDRDSLRQVGRFAVADLSSNSKTSVGHSRWVFFSADGINLYSVNQADAAAGLDNDFAVQKVVLFDPLTPPCVATPAITSATAPSFGGIATISITAPPECVYGASSDGVSIITSGTILAGSGTLTYLVRPNPGPGGRSGNIFIGTQVVTITQDAPAAVSSFSRLPYRIKDAEFSKAADRVIFVTTAPDELHIYDPLTNTDKWVALSLPPTAVSVRPDGQLAAVGHAGAISLIDLNSGQPFAIMPVPTIVKDLALANNGYAYVSGPNESGDFGAVDVTFGNLVRGSGFLGAPIRQNSNQPYVYLGSGIPSRLTFTPLPFTLQSLPLAGTACGGLFPTEDGSKVYTGCGEVRRTNASAAADFSLAGALSALGNGNGILAATDSVVRRTSIVIPYPLASNPAAGANEVQAYSDDSLNFSGRVQLPGFTVGATTYTARGNFVFWNAAADKIFVLETADPAANLTSPWASYTIGTGNVAEGCGITLNSSSVTISGAGGSASVGVSTGQNCAYVATSNASWITVTGGGFGIGSGNVQVTAEPAISNSPRSGTVTIGNQTLTVNEGGIPIVVTLNPTSATFASAGGPGGFTLTSSSGSFAWTAVSNAAWVVITSGASGTGSGAVAFNVLANASANPRSTTITAGGQSFTINQSGVPATIGINPSSANVAAGGGTGTVTVNISPSDLIWTAQSNAVFISIVNGTSGTGTGQVTYQVDANPTLSPRSGTLTIAGQTFTINQAAGSPSITFSPGFAFFTSAAATSSFNVNTVPLVFAWVATSNAPWITITAGSTGSGFGVVSYSITANLATTARSGTISVNGQAFTISQAGVGGSAGNGLRFVPVTPCRISDSRNPAGPFGGPTLSGSRDFNIPGSACGIPATAKAYSLNITVVPVGQLSYLTIWPAGSAQPVVSTLNSFDGRIKANAAIVPAGVNGGVSVFVSNPSDVIIDINGYFTTDTGASALVFYPLSPCRLVDTRGGPGALSGPRMTAGQNRTFPLQSGACGIPVTAQAYSLNMTAVPQGTLSYLTTWPTGSTKPLVSTLNSPTGTIVANAAIVPAGISGAIDVFVTDPTDVVIDVNGYFAPPAAGGLSFYAATPCRLVDTRLQNGPFGGPSMTTNSARDFILPFSSCNLPSTAQAYSLNATVVPAVSLSYITLWPFGSNQPVVSTLNAFDASVTSNAAIVPAGINGGITTFVTNQTDLILDVNGYFAP